MLLLNLLPAPLHRALYRLAHAVRRRVWRITGMPVEGVRMLAFDGEGRVLLVRHSYGSGQWMPPGGGLHRGEDPVLAGVRELIEETGCRVRDARLAGRIDEPMVQGTQHCVHLVVGAAEGEPRPDNREIVAARFFAADSLPDDLAANLRAQVLAQLAKGAAGIWPVID